MTRWTRGFLPFLAAGAVLLALALFWRHLAARPDSGVLPDTPVKTWPSGQVAAPVAGPAAPPASARQTAARRKPPRAAGKGVAAKPGTGTAAETAAQPAAPATPRPAAARSALREQAVEKWEAFVDQIAERAAPPDAGQMEQFKKEFARLHADDQRDALQTALNLLPDEQFVSLFAILFDKSQNPEVLDEIFNDALNRPEEIKVPMMKTLLQDKGHPLHAEAARILDATGELDDDDGNDAKAATP